MVPKQKPGEMGQRKRGDPVDPLQNPLDLLAADHSAERDACALIERIATAQGPMPDDAKRVLSFLIEAYRNHLKDEEDDLFPLLRLRCEPEDEIDRILGQVLEAADGDFNMLLELGFAESIKREWAWRVSRGESLANLQAF